MSYKPSFNYHPSKRSRKNANDTYDENGTPLYSEKRTAGTEKGDAILGTRLSDDKKRIITTRPIPVPPNRLIGSR